MSTYKIFTRHFMGWILTALILVVFAQVSISHGAGRLLAWSVDDGVTQSQSNVSLEPYEVRKGQIALSSEILPKPAGAANQQTDISVSKGDTDTASISFFANVTYEVIIDSVNHSADGTMIISGKLKDHKIGTVVMTIGADGFLITAQDMNQALLYRATGDSRQGSGTVTEIDMKKIPPTVR